MDSKIHLILCEGDSDVSFLTKILTVDYEVKTLVEKDRVLRTLIEKKIIGNKVFIINEGGKTNLDRNLRIMVSKLRSIDREVNVFVLRDSDNDPKHVFEKIHSDIQQVVNVRFPSESYKPVLKPLDNVSNYYYLLKIEYVSKNTLNIHLFIITKNLEYWVKDRGLNTIGKLKQNSPWFNNLIDTMENLGLLLKSRLNDNTSLV